MKNPLIEKCYMKSLELLEKNSSDCGFLASAPQKRAIERDYLSVFARDASICSLGAIASREKRLIRAAKRSLKLLAANQADNGQIPNYVKPGEGYADFWKLGCIDATLWWLIALKAYDRGTKDKKLRLSLKKKADKAINWLSCQEHPKSRLLVQNEASDWADIFPRSGKVLYSNSLWLKVKEEYGLKDLSGTKKSFFDNFYPFDDDLEKVERPDNPTIKEIVKSAKEANYFLSYLNYFFWGKDLDVYGNSLALIFAAAKKKLSKRIIENILSCRRYKNLPIPVLFYPIKANSREWRKYMESHKQNFPQQYHNGGVWPFASCFWAMALFRNGFEKEAGRELEKIAGANSLKNWQFNEWFHAKTGKAMGMKGQSWNAGAFLLAYHFLKGEF